MVDRHPLSATDAEVFSYDSETWRYGDEASLYSIAEDSREDRASEIASRAGTDGGTPAHLERDTSIEVQWNAPSPKQDDLELTTDASDEEDSDERSQPTSRRCRYIILGFFVLSLVMAIVLGVTMTRPRSNSSSVQTDRTQDTSNNEDVNVPVDEPPTETETDPADASQEDPVEATDTVVVDEPSPAPTVFSSPLVEGFVTAALQMCADLSPLGNSNSVQRTVYDRLVREVDAASTHGDGGLIDIPLEYGYEMIMERYALMMLYETTGGQGWLQADEWGSTGDVCDWYGVNGCTTRVEGSCAVLSVRLGTLEWR